MVLGVSDALLLILQTYNMAVSDKGSQKKLTHRLHLSGSSISWDP